MLMTDTLKPLLSRLADGQTLDRDQARAFLDACLRGEPTPAQVAAALTALKMRGETVEEISAFAEAMREAAHTLDHPYDVVDTCGTGGDGQHTYNISTAAALVLAGAGVKVAKHGNRALSSKSGTSDVLSALGVNLAATRGQQRRSLDEAGIAFLFAPAHHPAMRHVTPIRAELGFRTVFNLIGPLSNPARARRQLMGVYDPRLIEALAEALGRLGAVHAWVVHGQGLDELTTTGESEVAEWRDGALNRLTIRPEDAGRAGQGLQQSPVRRKTGRLYVAFGLLERRQRGRQQRQQLERRDPVGRVRGELDQVLQWPGFLQGWPCDVPGARKPRPDEFACEFE